MDRKIVFTNRIAEVFVVLLMVLNFIENIFEILDSFSMPRIFISLFLIILIYLYGIKHKLFKTGLKLWASLLVFACGIAIIYSLMSTSDISDLNLLISFFGFVMGITLFYISIEFVKYE